jgi:hypothetical protein
LIAWPKGYGPEETSAHVSAQLDMPVPPEAVWAWLLRADLWPTWCPEFKDVRIEGGGPDLEQGSRFRWKAFGVRLTSSVEEFVPLERLCWTARSTGIDAYHAWLIERLPSGCRVVSEETQSGWVARLNNLLRPRSLVRIHETWLERLLEKAKGGPP